jgi:hypothetical protein
MGRAEIISGQAGRQAGKKKSCSRIEIQEIQAIRDPGDSGDQRSRIDKKYSGTLI